MIGYYLIGKGEDFTPVRQHCVGMDAADRVR